MNEQLKIIITAEIDKLKQATDNAKKHINGFKEQVANAKKDVDDKFKAIGDGIHNAVSTGFKAATTAAAAGGAAIAGAIAKSVMNYADYEQLVGGVEKLFGNSSKTVMAYAENAYKNAGVSANDYMNQITSFSASLISSLGGDTEEAARIGNMAVEDMADNANVFGSNLADIQHAYQGFAKQNYTMLDNLKLGYGGTKTEMMRLIDDANKVLETMGKTGDLTITEFGDVITAIHLIQGEMNITGTTAKEGAATISGSIGMTKAAWENLLTGLADGNANIPQLVSNVLSSATSVIKNIIPAVKEVLLNIPVAISEISPEAGAAMQTVIDFVVAAFPVLQDAVKVAFDVVKEAFTFIKDNKETLAGVATAIGIVVVAIEAYNAVAAVKALMAAKEVATLGALIAAYAAQAVAMAAAIAPYVLIVAAIAAVVAAIVLCVKHWDEIKAKTKEVMGNIKQWVSEATNNVKQKIQEMAKKAVSFFAELKQGATDKINGMKTAVVNTVTNIANSIRDKFNNAKTTALSIFDSIKTGIQDKIESAKNFITNAVEKIKGVFNFDWSLPKIKLPHFNVSGGKAPWGFMGEGSLPSISIDWYAKGGVFDSPTFFNYGGNIGGLGENGAEAIVPLENNTKWLDRLAEMLSDKLGINQPIVLNVDGKTFAQISCDSINQLTRQRGSIPLNII